jgi:release factor glutamine methyltransferase
VTLQTALQQGVAILERAAIPVSRLTAEVLLCHALQRDRAYLYAHSDDELSELVWIHYGRYLSDRLNGRPTQYITHKQEFYGREFYVDEAVLIPRPETEHLVEAGIRYVQAQPSARVLDVGTGSAAIAISVAMETGVPVLASDISTGALRVAERNRAKYNAPVSFFAADLLAPVRPRSLDLLISNPPYVPGADAANMQPEVRDWEPAMALFAGDSGLEIYRRLTAEAAVALRPGARLMMELGYRSLEGVREMLSGAWTDFEVISDLAGFPRVLAATLKR